MNPEDPSVNNSVNTHGGPYIHGNINTAGGDFIGRDQVIIQRLDPADARNQRNHKVMRQLVRTFWIDGVLKSSLYNEVLIRLNMEKRPMPWIIGLGI